MPEIPRGAVGRPRRFVSPEQVRELRRAGLSFRQIAQKTGFGYGSVRRAYIAEEARKAGEEPRHNCL